MINRLDYIKNSNLHNAYYSQFVTEDTKKFVLDNIGLKKLLQSNDNGLFNDIGIQYSNGGAGQWVWDYAPINLELLKICSESDSLSVITCIAKAAARIILAENTAI